MSEWLLSNAHKTRKRVPQSIHIAVFLLVSTEACNVFVINYWASFYQDWWLFSLNQKFQFPDTAVKWMRKWKQLFA